MNQVNPLIYNEKGLGNDEYTKIDAVYSTETPPSDGISKVTKWPRVYTDTPTGEPISLTEEEFKNMVELYHMLAAIRDRNKTPA